MQNQTLVAIAMMISIPQGLGENLETPAQVAPPSETECLSKVIYFEARGEPVEGQIAVGQVVLNRVRSRLYPNGICQVIEQQNQFAPQIQITEPHSYHQARQIARWVLSGAPDSSNGATHFFNPHQANPNWAAAYTLTASIGDHEFYK